MTKKDHIKVAEIIKAENENIESLDVSAGTQAAARVELSIVER